MKNNIIYISFLIFLGSLWSCSLEEINNPLKEDQSVELIVRPTSFLSHNVATKSTRAITVTELTEAESRIVSAYYIVFNSAGNRVIYEKLNVTDNVIPSKTLLSDFGGGEVTICVIANVPEAVVGEIKSISDLASKTLALTYATYDETGYIGIPIIDGQYCFPMFGKTTCSPQSVESQVVIDLKRLFAKVQINLNLDLSESGESGTKEASFKLGKIIIKNIPNQVKLTEGKTLDENENEVLTESEWVSDGNSFEDEFEISFNEPITLLDDKDPTNGYKISFYVPEYILLPDSEKLMNTEAMPDEKREGLKPTLIKDGTFPVSMTILGDYFSVFGDEIEMTYNIFFGEDKYSSFSLLRNIMYTNNITIRGTSVIDNRVEMKYAGFRVGFPHSVKMDAHFNVRPLRLQFTEEFIKGIEEGLYSDGEIKIEVQRGSGQNTSWIALERPIKSEISENSLYANSGIYPTKRKYFTTNLIYELDNKKLADGKDDPTAGSSVTFHTKDSDAMTGNVITWVYVDEYNTRSATSYREATLAVTFTMDGASEGVTKNYIVRQSAMYPMTIWDGLSPVYYGIELFEEYTMDYDALNHYYDDDQNGDVGFDGGIVSTVNGFPWGLQEVDLSRNRPALHAQNVQVTLSDDTSPELQKYLQTGLGDFNGLSIVQSLVESGMKSRLQDLDSYYDFYTSDDVNDGILSTLFGTGEARDYEGYLMNLEIIRTLLAEHGEEDHAKLNEITLDEDPLSAIAYCYNKNKRNEKGEVAYLNQDGSLNISNYHWYAPSINELEDIIEYTYNNGEWLNAEFQTFANNYYWSCQPAYLNNDLKVSFEAQTNWTINGTNFWGRVTSTKTLTGKFLASGAGDFLQDDVIRARATKYDIENKSVVTSGSAHKSKRMNIIGSFTSGHTHTSNAYLLNANNVAADLSNLLYTAYTLPYFAELNTYLSGVSWNKSGVIPSGSEELEPSERGLGNMPRTTSNRVRCVYYPHSYTKATRSEASGIESLFKKGYETTLQ